MEIENVREQKFKEWCHSRKNSKHGWIAEDAKIIWLSGNKEWNNRNMQFSSIKELLFEIEQLSIEEINDIQSLPTNLFTLDRELFKLKKGLIDRIIQAHKSELQTIIGRRYTGKPGRPQYANFKMTNYAKEYLQFLESDNEEMVSDYVNKLTSSKNLILRGAPGTGKTYLARQMAAEIIGCSLDDLEHSEQFGFVQFHPNYDYTDFVEGLRPVKTDNDSIAFERRNGIFMDFCERAKDSSLAGGQDNFDEVWEKYLEYINNQETKEYITKSSYLTVNSNHNLSVNYDSGAQGWSLPRNYVYELYKDAEYNQQTYYRSGGQTVIENMKNRFGLLNYIPPQETTQNKPFIFVIDEINRGDMAKIFGELFFSLDPGYRGKTGAVTTQFANLYDGSEGKVQGDKFYIPENVYIIGTMNDIDRSVDSFDFAMRRRFRFIEVTAESQLGMLDSLDDFADEAKARLRTLNDQISETEDLNQNYHIGPSYFLKLKELDHDYDVLWSDYLEPLLAEYLRGTYGEEDKLEALKEAYHISIGEDDVANG